MTARLDPEHAKAGVGVVEGDPLDQAGQDFLCRLLWLRFHGDVGHDRTYKIERIGLLLRSGQKGALKPRIQNRGH